MRGQAYVANIGSRQRRSRLLAGVASISAAAALVALLVASDVSRWWRLLVFLPWWAGALGILQHREKT